MGEHELLVRPAFLRAGAPLRPRRASHYLSCRARAPSLARHPRNRTMSRTLHHRAFAVSVGWTLILLFLGSVVHATHSSLACPDWPTCYGTMVPVMQGGVFWEHLHRLVAGGLILMWGLATWLAWREGAPARVRRWTVVGIGLILLQAVFGGITVLYRLPPAVSTTHLSLAFLFLTLTVVLEEVTSRPRAEGARSLTPAGRRALRRWGGFGAVAVFAQSVLGALVRHTGAGTACGLSGFLCLQYRGFPPLSDDLAFIHFLHRCVGVTLALVVAAVAVVVSRRAPLPRVRALAALAVALVLVQITLGFAAAWTGLSVVPDSLHTLGAASLLATQVALATNGWAPAAAPRPSGAQARAAA